MNQQDKELVLRIAEDLRIRHLIDDEPVYEFVHRYHLTKLAEAREPVGYQKLVNAIAASVKVAPVGMAISVKRFKESIGGEIFTSPPRHEILEAQAVALEEAAGRCESEITSSVDGWEYNKGVNDCVDVLLQLAAQYRAQIVEGK